MLDIILIPALGMAISALYAAWNNIQANRWAHREIDIFEEAMYRKRNDDRNILEHIKEIKSERGIKKDLIDHLLMAEYKYQKWKKGEK